MADENEIDLYDNVDDVWKRESLDLYDDDEESHSNSDNQKETVPSSKPRYAGKRVATYIGNLRWWTTDQDIMEALHKLDIKDILEIKFHENRQNGQSKGFCVAVFGSDKSAKEAMDKLPKSELHTLAPIVTYCNKQNLNYFEQAAGGGSSSDSPSNNNNNNNNSNNNNNNGGNKMKTEMNINNGPSMMNTNANPMQIGALGGIGGCNNMRFPGNMAMQGMAAGINPSLLFNLSQFTQNTMNRAPPNMMMHNAINGPINMGQGAMNMSMAGQRLMQSSMMMQPGMHMPGVGGVTGGGVSSGPTPHLNPNFFNGVGGVTGIGGGQPGSLLGLANHPQINRSSTNQPHQPYDTFGRPIASSSANYSTLSISPKLSDNEFEEILQRNKTVSSSAINRAVQDASASDYASAIETLVTAISLIKQSKIAADNRCKVLINSLQDTLTGIESKSYGSRKVRNQRRRSFSGDGSSSSEYDGGGGGGSSRRVLRSRSRDRHTRSRRSRSRDVGQSSSSNTRGASRSTNNQQHSTSASNNDYISGSSDRYGASRYRH